MPNSLLAAAAMDRMRQGSSNPSLSAFKDVNKADNSDINGSSPSPPPAKKAKRSDCGDLKGMEDLVNGLNRSTTRKSSKSPPSVGSSFGITHDQNREISA